MFVQHSDNNKENRIQDEFIYRAFLSALLQSTIQETAKKEEKQTGKTAGNSYLNSETTFEFLLIHSPWWINCSFTLELENTGNRDYRDRQPVYILILVQHRLGYLILTLSRRLQCHHAENIMSIQRRSNLDVKLL